MQEPLAIDSEFVLVRSKSEQVHISNALFLLLHTNPGGDAT